jgi:hypothetical protein
MRDASLSIGRYINREVQTGIDIHLCELLGVAVKDEFPQSDHEIIKNFHTFYAFLIQLFMKKEY